MSSTGRSVVTYGAPLLLLGGASVACWLALGGAQTPFGPMRLTPLPPPTPVLSAQSDPATPPPTILESISPQQAELKNELLPYSHGPLLSGATYHASADARSSASECMTAAIYYEAGREPDAGKRAVAQVILNRASSPAFPHDVCGVVRQGASRLGCQFTFMCDGSLARRPDPVSWARAREIAEQALDGAVDATVGSATHYHADYVYPTWAPQMEKLVKVGRHIFYRWRGAKLNPPPTLDAIVTPSLTNTPSTDSQDRPEPPVGRARLEADSSNPASIDSSAPTPPSTIQHSDATASASATGTTPSAPSGNPWLANAAAQVHAPQARRAIPESSLRGQP